jgi:thiosulfate dehydrogenase
MNKRLLKLSILTLFVFGLLALANQNGVIAQKKKEADKKNDAPLTVQLCDGETKMEIASLREGDVMPPDLAREVAAKMMAAVAQEKTKQASKWTDRDRMTWEREQKRMVAEGDKLFHDWKGLNGTIGISCDMCHPNGSNTHPETYPKFQTQLKKVAALRDMINWCIENPMKGKPLALDDPRMLAVEAYITSTRKGVALDPGKH